jgi:hypothetical protein
MEGNISDVKGNGHQSRGIIKTINKEVHKKMAP